MDTVHEFSGHCPWSQWTSSMDWVDIVHGLSGYCPWTLVPILQPDNVHWVHGLSTDRLKRSCSDIHNEGEKSSDILVTSGVPQGSVLGPILFRQYKNNLPENINSQVRLFADDTAVYLTVTSKDDSQTLQQDHQKLETREKTWEIRFNPNKCQVLHITRGRNPLQTQYVLHGQVLEAVDHAKYLGLETGHNLNWNQHIHTVTTEANQTLGFIWRNIQTKHKGIHQAAFNTIVRPQAEYASPVWSPYTQTNINKIKAVQRRAACSRVTNNYSSYIHVTQMINTLGWRSLEQRRADAHLIMFYKIVYGLVEISLPPYIQRQVRMTRNMHPYHFIQIHTSTNYYKYSFFPLAIVQCCPFWWPDHVQVYHLQPTSHHAISRESLFLSAFKLLVLPHTNTILLF